MSELGNYRPIAVISSFFKVLERLVYNKLMSFLEKGCLLFKLVATLSVETSFVRGLRYANVSLTRSLIHSGVDTVRN